MGNRTIMMNDGQIILDVKGEERSNLTVNNLWNSLKTLQAKCLITTECCCRDKYYTGKGVLPFLFLYNVVIYLLHTAA
jgi:hypothetical protein